MSKHSASDKKKADESIGFFVGLIVELFLLSLLFLYQFPVIIVCEALAYTGVIIWAIRRKNRHKEVNKQTTATNSDGLRGDVNASDAE